MGEEELDLKSSKKDVDETQGKSFLPVRGIGYLNSFLRRLGTSSRQ